MDLHTFLQLNVVANAKCDVNEKRERNGKKENRDTDRLSNGCARKHWNRTFRAVYLA